jgi:hypothetical protein
MTHEGGKEMARGSNQMLDGGQVIVDHLIIDGRYGPGAS